jgi:hypothetical protein
MRIYKGIEEKKDTFLKHHTMVVDGKRRIGDW